jgi:hypothetical protein
VSAQKPIYQIHLTPTGAGPPPEVRLRRGLKYLLRACGLRCVDLRQLPHADGNDQSQRPTPQEESRP